MPMNQPRRRRATTAAALLTLVCSVGLASVPRTARAEDDEGAVTVQLRDGEVVRGRLLELRSGVLRVRVNDSIREIPEKRLRRIDFHGDGDLLQVEDVLPRMDRLTWCAKLRRVKQFDRAALEGEAEDARRKSTRDRKPEDTLFLEATEGAVEWRRLTYVENLLSRTARVWVGRYETAAAAEASVAAWRRFVANEQRPGRAEVTLVRNMTLTGFFDGLTRQADESLRRALLDRCEEVAPGEARRVTSTAPYGPFFPATLVLPAAWRPATCTRLDPDDDDVGRFLDPERRAELVYSGEAGAIRIRYEPRLAPRVRPYDCDRILDSWRWGKRAVLLLARGEPSAEAVATFTDFVAFELARRPDSRHARRVAADEWPAVRPAAVTEQVRREAAQLVDVIATGDATAILERMSYAAEISVATALPAGGGVRRESHPGHVVAEFFVRCREPDSVLGPGAHLIDVTAIEPAGADEDAAGLAALLPAGGFTVTAETTKKRVELIVTTHFDIVGLATRDKP